MPIHEIQLGFVPCDGIAENNFLFALILKDGNTVTSETAIVLLGSARAFDSVGYVLLFSALERLGRIGARGSSLKPDQLVTLLGKYAVPRLLHQTKYCPISRLVLDILDRLIRITVKEWVRLPPSATDGVLYAANSYGGLAIPNLKSILPIVKAKAFRRLSKSYFSIVPEMLDALTDEERISIWCESQKRKERRHWRTEEALGWEWLPVQGVSVRHFLESNVSNIWLRGPQGVKASTWCRSLQLRTDTYRTRAAVIRGKVTHLGAVAEACSSVPALVASFLCSLMVKQTMDIRDDAYACSRKTVGNFLDSQLSSTFCRELLFVPRPRAIRQRRGTLPVLVSLGWGQQMMRGFAVVRQSRL
ncbi:hypothetical protein AVEN_234235-1 [Araneus ventricosus]|uniref:Reverse transcriptase domain-containing protein n=1 Tax=Araneus ventricosus TaxID=182803 RepID=A0A4Y2A7Z5_ARAVE|nr:hypothetical protein AVEN_234235-1 [Araneus ventricosus]